MVIENPIPPFYLWIGIAAAKWLFAVAILLLVAFLTGFVVILIRRGPGQVFPLFFRGVKNGWEDLTQISFRRVFAVARLIIQESIRKKVVTVCVIFLILLMFAGWFIDPSNNNPAALYLNFVLSTTNYLILLLALFLSALSLPADFKNKTIFTLVTKPVRSSEIVLGRILGLAAVGTVILLFMAILSYFFVTMSLKHSHKLIDGEDMKPVAEASDLQGTGENAANLVIARGRTQWASGHAHDVEEYADGTFSVAVENNHTHTVRKVVDGDDVRYIVGPQLGTVQARVPIYGKIRFRDGSGYEKSSGISVGEEWEYRSYVAGASPEAMIWTFENVTPYQFKEGGLPIEMSLSVYRTHKGDMEQKVMGELLVRNPRTGLTAGTNIFHSEKNRTKAVFVPEKIDKSKLKGVQEVKVYGENETPLPSIDLDPSKETYDLFEDFVDNGRLEIWVQCLEDGQYFGAAEADLYIRSKDANVFLNFLKAYFGIWEQMVILLSFGVLFSTFLSGPVAMFSTFGVMIAAFCRELLLNVALMRELGGGPFEAWERLISGANLMSDLSNTFGTYLIKFFDLLTSLFLSFIALAIPSFKDFHDIYSESVQKGFNIPLNTLAVHGVTTLAFVIPLFIVGYLILRNREVAK